ncbi:MAG: hypothetical protein GC204_14910 [Chloroflexi bacterium]|nr:hypothetical protein [Chloroflexota bacterium]
MTTDVVSLLFLAIHIISAGFWISQFVAVMALERFAATVKGKPAEVAVKMAEGNVESLLGTFGGMGILISGLVLTFQFHYGILGIGGVYTPTWLVIKQVIFIIAMGIVGSMVTRPARPIMEALGKALTGGQPAPAEAVSALNRVQLMSRIVNVLVVINILIGVFGVNGSYMAGR